MGHRGGGGGGGAGAAAAAAAFQMSGAASEAAEPLGGVGGASNSHRLMFKGNSMTAEVDMNVTAAHEQAAAAAASARLLYEAADHNTIGAAAAETGRRASRDCGGGGGGGGAPCGACKFLRRKCVKGCVFAPYFGAEHGAARFAAVHKIFGASNVSKLLGRIPPHKRFEAVITISYEAQARISNPVYGCVAQIAELQKQVLELQNQLSMVQAQLASSRQIAAAASLAMQQAQAQSSHAAAAPPSAAMFAAYDPAAAAAERGANNSNNNNNNNNVGMIEAPVHMHHLSLNYPTRSLLMIKAEDSDLLNPTHHTHTHNTHNTHNNHNIPMYDISIGPPCSTTLVSGSLSGPGHAHYLNHLHSSQHTHQHHHDHKSDGHHQHQHQHQHHPPHAHAPTATSSSNSSSDLHPLQLRTTASCTQHTCFGDPSPPSSH